MKVQVMCSIVLTALDCVKQKLLLAGCLTVDWSKWEDLLFWTRSSGWLFSECARKR